MSVFLLGRFRVVVNGVDSPAFRCAKVQELLAFLLINQGRSLQRDRVASEIWDDECATPRKNLRHLLWKLQNALGELTGAPEIEIQSDGADWIRCEPAPEIWIDVSAIESAFAAVGVQEGPVLPDRVHRRLTDAVELYSGHLLEGCDQHWSLIERERLRDVYGAMLDALMDHALATGAVGQGLECARLSLREDYAREQTHQRLMALLALSGDRTGALRQYGRCREALRREFDVEPSSATEFLHEQIRDGASRATTPWTSHSAPEGLIAELRVLLAELRRVLASVSPDRGPDA